MMKKNIFWLLLFLGTFLLSGCGGGSDNISGGGASGNNPLSAQLQNVNFNGLDLNGSIIITKEVDNSYQITLTGYDLKAIGCTLDSVTFTQDPYNVVLNGDDGSLGSLIFGAAYKVPCTTSTFQLDITMTVTQGSVMENIIKSYTIEAGGSGGGTTPSTDLKFKNADTPVLVNEVNKEYDLSVQLVRGDYGASGQQVRIKYFDNPGFIYGKITDQDLVADENGYAIFKYTSPDSLEEINGTSLTLTLATEDNGTEITQEIKLDFLSGGVDPSYSFINTSTIEINQGSEKKDIKTQLTYQNIPIAGKKVEMLAFSDTNGSIINGYTVQTDGLGYATFSYMAPETLDDVNGTTLKLTIQFEEDDVKIKTYADVTFLSKPNDTGDEDVTPPIVVIPNDKEIITLTSNSQTIELALKVFKDITPYTQGSVKVELPQKVLNGTDVGKFESYEVPVDASGIATFVYTGPSNLRALVAIDDNESIFKFYHVENTAGKKEVKVLYRPSDPYISRNYELDVSTDGEFSMGIPNKEKTFSVVLRARDGSGDEVSLTDENITKITVLTTNSSIAQLFDTVETKLVDSIDIESRNNSSFILRSKTLSGLVPLEITVEFKDVNGDPQTLTTIVNVRVFSGPPSAISISYVRTGQDDERAKYIETLAISATDEYGNKVNTKPNISLGAIVGYAVDGRELNSKETNETRRLFYGKSDVDGGLAEGEINDLADGNVSSTEFSDSTPARFNVFRYVNKEGNNTDKLVTFGLGKNYEAMGKWDMALGVDNHILTLQDDYYGTYRTGLYYTVGHNYYQDQCLEDGREWIGITDSDTYQLDEEGTVTIEYNYDYHLAGKDATIWVNLDGLQPDTNKITRIGEAIKHTLRSGGLISTPTGGYSVPRFGAGYARFEIWHENAPEPYRNAHFSHDIAAGSNCSYSLVASTNAFDARTCDSTFYADVDDNVSTPDVPFYGVSGRAYVTYYIWDATGSGCSFNIENILVSDEF